MPIATAVAEPHRPARASWMLSALLHVVFMLVIGWVFQTTPAGTTTEPARRVALVLKRITSDGEMYEGEDDLPPAQTDPAEATDNRSLTAALADAPAEFDPSDVLPDLPLPGPGALPGGATGDANLLTQGASQPSIVSGGKASVNVYGITGEGRKFVYVFDRSLSMSGAPLASAKVQLLGSLDALESTHQFQILFFNNNVHVFDLTGGQARIPFASDRTKDLAARFVGGVTADGGTDRYAALMRGVSMRPDIIFFLTDSDDPMTRHELDRIRRKNKEMCVIHSIEFGHGSFSGRQNFLHRIARQNGGQWIYVDTSRL